MNAPGSLEAGAEACPETHPEALAALQEALLRARAQALRAPPRINLVEWADTYRHLAREAGSTGGRWSTARVAIAKGPMLAVTEPGVQTITVMSCTQLMKTSFLENVFGYFAHLDPSPILIVQPKDEAAAAFSKERIAPMVRATPELRKLVGDPRSRRSDDTITFKTFPGGFAAIVAAGSPTNLAMRAIRVTLLDEIDKYQPTKEGDPVTLAEERTATFPTSRLSIRACSPTEEGVSRVEKSYRESDQRRAFLACPHCDHEQVLDFFQHVEWTKGPDGEHLTETAAVHCEACGTAWSEPERLAAVAAARWKQTKAFLCCGELQGPMETRSWRHDEKNGVHRATCRHCGRDGVPNRHAGFHASKLHSPWITMAELASKWIEAKDDPDLRQTFYNTQLGIPSKPPVAREGKASVLMERREVYPAEVPDGVAVLTLGADTQDDRLVYEIVGWGRDEENWSIEAGVILGDTSKPDVWQRLDEKLRQEWSRIDGRAFKIEAAAIDTGGHSTEAAYDFCRSRLSRRVWAIKGRNEAKGARSPVWPRKPSRTRKGAGTALFVIGTNAAKDHIAAHLAAASPGPNYCHFPDDREAAWFDELTAERSVVRTFAGTRVRVWEPIPGRRNEAWDCRVYAYAALAGLMSAGFRLNARAEQVAPVADEGHDAGPTQPPVPEARGAQPSRGGGGAWLNRGGGRWLGR